MVTTRTRSPALPSLLPKTQTSNPEKPIEKEESPQMPSSTNEEEDDDGDDDVYEIDKIKHSRIKKGKEQKGIREYLISWKGYSSKYDQWVAATDITAPDVMKEYWSSQGKSQVVPSKITPVKSKRQPRSHLSMASTSASSGTRHKKLDSHNKDRESSPKKRQRLIHDYDEVSGGYESSHSSSFDSLEDEETLDVDIDVPVIRAEKLRPKTMNPKQSVWDAYASAVKQGRNSLSFRTSTPTQINDSEEESTVKNGHSDDDVKVQLQLRGSNNRASSSSTLSDGIGNGHESITDFIADDDDHDDNEWRKLLPTSQVQALEYHFSNYVQCLVYQILLPEVDWLEENKSWSESLEALERVMRGIKDSVVSSSVWNKNFRKKLDTLPGITETKHQHISLGCQACDNSQKKAQFEIFFHGQPYDEKTLQPLTDDDESSDSSEEGRDPDDKKPNRRHQKSFLVGGTCSSRALAYHGLSHWRYELYHEAVYPAVNRLLPDSSYEVSRKREPKGKAREAREARLSEQATKIFHQFISQKSRYMSKWWTTMYGSHKQRGEMMLSLL